MRTGLVCLMSFVLACGGDGDGGGGALEDLQSIEVSPANAVLVVEDGVAATQAYTATGTFSNGETRDISAEVTFSIAEPALGNFSGETLTTSALRGGQSQVVARSGTLAGTTGVTVLYRRAYPDPAGGDVPDDAADLFAGASESAALDSQVVYPNHNVLVPPNLGQLEFHWVPAGAATLFELGFRSPTTDVKVYTTCANPMNGGCIYTPDASVWAWIAESNRGLSGVTVTVRATDDGTGVGSSNEVRVGFSQDDIDGGIYYWTTSTVDGDDTAIMRYDFANRSQTVAERFVGTEATGDNCVGCHALSRDGTKLVVAADGSYSAYVLLMDVATQTAVVPFNSTPRSAFTSWNPDGSRYVGVFADEQDGGSAFLSYDLNVFDGNTGAFIETIDVGGTEASPTDHPDWSPLGDQIVFTKVGVADTDSGTLASVQQCSLAVTTFDGASWSTPVDLTGSEVGVSTYYPTFSPAGDLIAFNRSECGNGQNGADCNAYDDPEAQLLVMKPEAGQTPVALAAANAPGVMDEVSMVQNSFPKWAPFTFRRTGEISSRLHWLTFSSDRRYGLRDIPDSHTLVWMAGVNPDGTGDPSSPAFALPFQDLSTDNHTAQWTERVVGTVD